MDIGKDLQDAYECGRQDALTELMEYTYGMLTAEKFGLQHRIKSMMADRKTENSSEKPNNCETCKHYNPDHEAIACERCLGGKRGRVMGEENKDSKANLLYVEWLEQVVAEYQPDWICDELVTEDSWCYDRCESKWDRDCLKRYYNKHFDTADAPQTEVTTDCRQTKMSLDDAYYLVYKDLTKEDGLLTGKYDAKNGNKQYMNGVWSVMELIAYGVGIDCYEAFNERFCRNLEKSQEQTDEPQTERREDGNESNDCSRER